MTLTRRETLTLAAAATFAGIVGLPTIGFAKDGDVIDQLKLMAPNGLADKVDGNADAKVTLIEYASPTCPHCALFANTVLQPFKDKYVASGKVKFILRPFARNTTDAAIFMLAEAAAVAADAPAGVAPADASAASAAASSAPVETGKPGGYSPAAVSAYENVIATYFRTQETWGSADKLLDALHAIATQLGFSDAAFDAALKDQAVFDKIGTMRDQASNDFGLTGTPTFYINGKMFSGEKTLDALSAEIDPLLK